MNDDNFIVSGFDDRNEAAAMTVDFALAKSLDRSGSTCDAYECTVQRRRVFVKRLKAEYRDNPLYRAAFDKEYDLGVSLSHPSLPRYIGFGGDYIVMDFIEGDTLADLMTRDDPRLRNRKFVRRLLIELVDVVEYLHRRNIVHCDIKADNVIVSPYDDRPVSLIDLDKAYTSWLDTTHGNAEKYGCAGCADGAIDFRGIGKIASHLGQDKVARLCEMNDVSVESIKHTLGSRGINKLMLLLISSLVLGLSLSLWYVNRDRTSIYKPAEATPPQVITIPDTTTNIDKANSSQVNTPPELPSSAVPVATTIPEKKAVKPEKPDSAYITKIGDEIVLKYYGPLHAELDYLIELVNDSTSTGEQLDEALSPYVKRQMKVQSDIGKEVYQFFNLSECEDPQYVMRVFYSCKEWNRFINRDSEMGQLYFHDKRRKGKKTMP